MHKPSISETIRKEVLRAPGRYWRVSDFKGFSGAAVSKTLTRLAEAGELERVSKGIYYRPRLTKFGRTAPSQSELRALGTKQTVHPAGAMAANLLGLSTQNVVRGEFSTAAGSVPRKIIGARAHLHVGRPATWNKLSSTEAALLDLLRTRGKHSERSSAETVALLLDRMRDAGCFKQLLIAAADEPPRVRAMLGAIGQEIGRPENELKRLRETLNPLSKFDFGVFRTLAFAKEWQAK
jgi:hypothetical protein